MFIHSKPEYLKILVEYMNNKKIPYFSIQFIILFYTVSTIKAPKCSLHNYCTTHIILVTLVTVSCSCMKNVLEFLN